MRCCFRSAIGALLLAVGLAAPAAAEPAMWVVKDADSTVYLLGTFHLVKPGTQWRSDKIAAAFNGSSEVWIEASEGDDKLALQALILKHGVDLKHPLSTKLSPETKAKFDKAATDAGLEPAMLEPMRPWTAALAIAVAPLMREGYDPAQGVDKALEADAKAASKVVRTFETPEQQILFFAELPAETELAFLTQSIEEAEMGPALVDQMAEAWVDGEVEALDDLSFAKMKESAPELYDTLIVKRNKTWSEQIVRLMDGAGTSFIAVGAGHLTGESSLQALLAERGLAVTRY